jgi:phage FluMu protein Com
MTTSTGVSYTDLIEVRCPHCNKLLFKVKGVAVIEIVCKRCSSLCTWPDVKQVHVSATGPLERKTKVD